MKPELYCELCYLQLRFTEAGMPEESERLNVVITALLDDTDLDAARKRWAEENGIYDSPVRPSSLRSFAAS